MPAVLTKEPTMRNMSFSMTERQLLDGTKTVTRRLGWAWLTPGTRLRAVRKAMGLRKGEKVEPLCVIEVVSVRRERLLDIDKADIEREGFADLGIAGFVQMFCEHMGCQATDDVTRIEFRRVAE